MSSYSRMNVELARQAAARGPGEAQRLRDIPPDAPYEGKGPLFVWTGERWLDLQLWQALNADPRRGEEETIRVEPVRKPPRRADADTLWLFEEEG